MFLLDVSKMERMKGFDVSNYILEWRMVQRLLEKFCAEERGFLCKARWYHFSFFFYLFSSLQKNNELREI